MNFCNGALIASAVLLTFSPSVAITIYNHSNVRAEVIFKREESRSPNCSVSPHAAINDAKVFGVGDAPEPDYSSFTVTLYDDEIVTLAFNNVHKDAEIALTNIVKEKTSAASEPDSTWSGYFLDAARNGIYSLGLLGGGALGFKFGAMKGVELGSLVGIHLAQRVASALPPIVSYLVSPLLHSGGAAMGSAGGYVFGAAAGTLCLPLAFYAGWHAISLVVAYARVSNDEITSCAYELIDDGFVLMEDTSLEKSAEEAAEAQDSDEDGWVLVP